MKAISNVLGFLTFWLFGRKEEEVSIEIVLGLDWLWTEILLEVDFEAWIKLFEGWKGKSLDSGLEKNLMFVMEMKDGYLGHLKL